jgi:hypothetical protein
VVGPIVAAVIAIAVLWTATLQAHAAANESQDTSIPSPEASAATQEAHLFWDNPFQRILYVALSATDEQPGAKCPKFEVTAYTFFGIVIDRAFVDCEGITRSER